MTTSAPPHRPGEPGSTDLATRYRATRTLTERLAAPLSAEDACVQSMPDASPAKWHLAHTTWFFETVVIEALEPGYVSPFDGYRVLFNSYYQGIGRQHSRPARGLLTRPALVEVQAYRHAIDERLLRHLQRSPSQAVLDLVELGIHHEQQHQELLLMDIKHLFAQNPLLPAYHAPTAAPAHAAGAQHWRGFEGGLAEIGSDGDGGFVFDNERPRHRSFLAPYELAERPVTNAEFAEFIADGGYRQPLLWLADGWATVQREDWSCPAYWLPAGDGFEAFTLAGRQPLEAGAPVCHVSYYEADAYARWAGARLPTEQEWEHAATSSAVRGNFLESGRLSPIGSADGGLRQMFGDVWEWTASAYAPYPGFKPFAGAVAEYNGKFMANQLVLRGGCCVSPQAHLRASYRNFFYPHQRWQFAGLRLARDAG